jgi:hypothetical protein
MKMETVLGKEVNQENEGPSNSISVCASQSFAVPLSAKVRSANLLQSTPRFSCDRAVGLQPRAIIADRELQPQEGRRPRSVVDPPNPLSCQTL